MSDDKPITKDSTEQSSKSAVTYYEAVGRRKNATARVRLYVTTDEGMTLSGAAVAKGDFIVNGKSADAYFQGEVSKKVYLEPFRTTNTLGRFVTSIVVTGGGLAGQLGAVVHGLSRALETAEKEKFRPILKKRGFLTRDSRKKQRIKAGFAHKSRARKQSPKR